MPSREELEKELKDVKEAIYLYIIHAEEIIEEFDEDYLNEALDEWSKKEKDLEKQLEELDK